MQLLSNLYFRNITFDNYNITNLFIQLRICSLLSYKINYFQKYLFNVVTRNKKQIFLKTQKVLYKGKNTPKNV